MLAWKDGKVQLDPNGKIFLNGVCYSVGRSKPNTYDPKVHDSTLFSQDFFNWAQEVKRLHTFSSKLLSVVKQRFNLWSSTSLVMPAFLLHILNPRFFPIFDQHVERARRFLTGSILNASSVDIVIDNYTAYRSFWLELLSELNIDVAAVEYGQVKRIDDALWAMGKYLKQTKKTGARPVDEKSPTQNAHLAPSRPARTTETKNFTSRTHNTSSREFKNRVLQYAESMEQRKAMQLAAEELGVLLPPSYLKYPGSHVYRWRQQGFPK
jgi:hypothetical protein